MKILLDKIWAAKTTGGVTEGYLAVPLIALETFESSFS